MKRAVFNAVGKVMGNENLGKVFYNNQSAYLANKNSSETGCVFPMVIWSKFNMRQLDTANIGITHHSLISCGSRIQINIFPQYIDIGIVQNFNLKYSKLCRKNSSKILDMSPNTDRLERTDASAMNEDEYAELGFRHNLCH